MILNCYIKIFLTWAIILYVTTIGNSQAGGVQCSMVHSYPGQPNILNVYGIYTNYAGCNGSSTLTIQPFNQYTLQKAVTGFCLDHTAFATLFVSVDGIPRFSFNFDEINNNVQKQVSVSAGHHAIDYLLISGIHIDDCFVPQFDIPNPTQTCHNEFDVTNYCVGLNLNVAKTQEKCTVLNSGALTASASATVFLPNNSFTYKWFKNGSGSVYSTSATITGLSSQDVFSVTATDSYGNTASQSNITTGLNVDNVILIDAPPHACLNGDPVTLTGTPNNGTFSGPGIVSNKFFPKLVGPGTFTFTYTIPVQRAGCKNTETRKILVLPNPKYINRVISATATTMSDAWPTDFTDAAAPVGSTSGITNIAGLEANNLFSNGYKGIWRSEESYVYVEDRKQTNPTALNPSVKISLDGVYDTLPLYLYQSGDNSGCYPGWRKMNTVTKYNPHSYEIENKDILSRRTAALYGYYSTMPTATATNAAETEIAFNGFEEYNAGTNLFQGDVAAGNLSIYNQTNNSYQQYKEYEVTEAYDNVLTLGNITAEDFAKLSGLSVSVLGAPYDVYNNKTITGTYSISSTDPATLKITLTGFPYSAVWKGKVSFTQNPVPSSDISNKFTISTAQAHTGKNSLYVTSEVGFDQYKLKLIPAGTTNDGNYVLSAWIKSSNPKDSLTYQLSSGGLNRGIFVTYSDINGNLLSASLTVQPSGAIIEGWQKLEAIFTVPVNTYKVGLVLRPVVESGQGVYLDDIRIFPLTSNMKTYVYDKSNYRVSAVMDNNNYATKYYYDEQGNLFLIKKETEKGIQTIQESFGHQMEH